MTTYLKQHRPFLLFLGKFFFSYLILTLLYQFYLSTFDQATFEPDGMTYITTVHSSELLGLLGYDTSYSPHPTEPSYRFFFEGKSVARIIEGCNAISVIILYVAFLIAFTGKLKPTLIFLFGGILLIYVLNISRIAALVLGLVYYPEYEYLMHDILFPLFIYGVVFFLWVLWVRNFSTYGKPRP